ncbi:MAG: transcriptional repressor [Acidobacteriota bacterium]
MNERGPSHEDRLASLEAACRARGIAVTVQRRAVLEVLAESETHPSIDDVYEVVHRRFPEVSRSTIYRILESFAREGLVRKVFHAGRALRYDPRTDRHHHFTCTRCERVIDISDPRLDRLPLPDSLARASSFAVQDYTVQFFGLCPDCASE